MEKLLGQFSQNLMVAHGPRKND